MYEERVARLERAVAEGRVIRGNWSGGWVEGSLEGLACLLTWLSPEAGEAGSERACPTDVMPPWLAYLTPALNDRTSPEAWTRMVPRYAKLARRWGGLDAEGWGRAFASVHAALLREAQALYDPVKARTFTAELPRTPWALLELASDVANYRDGTWDRIASHVLDAVEAECEREDRLPEGVANE